MSQDIIKLTRIFDTEWVLGENLNTKTISTWHSHEYPIPIAAKDYNSWWVRKKCMFCGKEAPKEIINLIETLNKRRQNVNN